MSERKILQIALNEDQNTVIGFMLEITKTKASRLVRGMLLEWAARKLNVPGCVRGGECGIHCAGVCADAAATWFNTANKSFICEPCAKHLNERYLVCVPATDDHQPAFDMVKMRTLAEKQLDLEKIKQEKGEDDLLADLLKAAEAYSNRPKKNGDGKKKSAFDRVLERFAIDE